MKIYRLTVHANIEEGFTYIKDDFLSRDEMNILARGEELNIIDKEILLKNKKKKIANVFQKGPLGILVDQKFKELIIKNVIQSKINFLSVKIEGIDYSLLNILSHLECFDYGNSEFTVFKNSRPDKVIELKFITKNIPEKAIFRVKEKPFFLFVTEKLKSILEEADITGIRFNEDMNLTIGI